MAKKLAIDPLLILAGDAKQISYRPRLNHLTGGVTSTILLQQILFRWHNNAGKPFYKFKEACEHSLYRNGDSWCEELGFTRREFDTALERIGGRVVKGKRKPKNVLVYYWTDIARVTFYDVNETFLRGKLLSIYGMGEQP